MKTPNLPTPATATEMFLLAMVCELQRLNGNLEVLIAAKSAPPQPCPEGGSRDGADGVVALREPGKRKRL